MTENTEFLQSYLQSLKNHSDALNSLKLRHSELNKFKKEMEESTKNVTALQTVGQMIAEVVTVIKNSEEIFEQTRNITNPYLEKNYERMPSVEYSNTYIVKTNMGPKYIVGAKPGLVLKEGARVSLDMTTLTIMNILPREVDPAIFSMTADEQTVSYKSIGGLGNEVRELREVIELPLLNPEIFSRLGIKPPKGVLLYGPPGTGKTLMARAAAASLNVTFLRVVASSLIEKYIGESARMIRELFAYAKSKAPSVIFIDEIDAIGGKRTGSINSSDREVQRTLMELLNQMDGFSQLQQVKVIMATNRPDILDEALLRPGRLDRKIEISLPLLNARIEILKIYVHEKQNINIQLLGELTEGFNGADLCHLCTEAGYSAIRDERDHRIMSDYLKAVRKIRKNKQVEGRLEYSKK